MEIARRAKNTFQGIKRIVYSRTNSKNLHIKSTNSGQDRYIRFCIKCIFGLKISRWMAPSYIL